MQMFTLNFYFFLCFVLRILVGNPTTSIKNQVELVFLIHWLLLLLLLQLVFMRCFLLVSYAYFACVPFTCVFLSFTKKKLFQFSLHFKWIAAQCYQCTVLQNTKMKTKTPVFILMSQKGFKVSLKLFKIAARFPNGRKIENSMDY